MGKCKSKHMPINLELDLPVAEELPVGVPMHDDFDDFDESVDSYDDNSDDSPMVIDFSYQLVSEPLVLRGEVPESSEESSEDEWLVGTCLDTNNKPQGKKKGKKKRNKRKKRKKIPKRKKRKKRN